MQLNSKAKRYLRSLAHPLEPVVWVGKAGIEPRVVQAVDQALTDHELIKVKLQPEAPVDRHEGAEQLAGQTGAALVQVLGRQFVLYRPHPEKPTIELPRGAQAATTNEDLAEPLVASKA